MQATRLSTLDASFLEVETPTAHMHVGWASLFDAPEGRARPTFGELLDHVASRLGRAPRYRQRLATVPLGAADPVWIDDERFDVERHVRRAETDDFDSLIDEVMSRQLDRARPLWEVWIADRLADGRVGVVGKAHHCMVDGLAAVELATLLLDPTPEPEPPESDGWRPHQAPGHFELLTDGIASRARDVLGLVTLPARLATHPRRALRTPVLAVEAIRAVSLSARPAGRSRFTRPGSSLRHLARHARPLEDFRTIKRAFDMTVNDVLLAAVAGGARAYQLEHRDDPQPLKTMVPVSLREPDGEGSLGNRISFVFIELPCDEPDPVRRLADIASAMGRAKDAGAPEGAGALLDAFGYAPRTVQHLVSRALASPRTFDLVVSNIPGPAERLWMRGCELKEAYPVVPAAERHSLSVGLTTVGETGFLGFYADRDALPDAERFRELVAAEFDTLLAHAA